MVNYNISRCVIHIMDSSINLPVLSEDLVKFTTVTTNYSHNLVNNLEKNMLVGMQLNSIENPIVKSITDFLIADDFINMSHTIAKFIYNMLIEKYNSFLWDLVVFEYQEYSKNKIGIAFLEYSKSFTHKLREGSSDNIIDFSVYEANLPSIKSKIKYGFIFDIDDNVWRFSEENTFVDEYLFELKKPVPSVKVYESVVKTVKSIMSDTNNDEAVEELINSINIDIKKHGEKNGVINIYEEVEKHLKPADIDEFNNKMKVNDIEVKEIKYDEKIKKRIDKKKKITTTDGIEVSIPMELFNDSNKVQLLIGDDGRVTIQLMNLNIK